jgi:hypothetical protein
MMVNMARMSSRPIVKTKASNNNSPYPTHLNKMECLNERTAPSLKLLEQCSSQLDYPRAIRKKQWATACYIQNRVPHDTDPNATPYFHWFGKAPNVQHFRIFGCAAYPVKALKSRKKLDPTSSRMIFVGYGDRFGVKAYRLYDPAHRRFQLAHSVYFDESSLISPQSDNNNPNITSSTPSISPTLSKSFDPNTLSNPQVR